jgi:hypothetical protein
MHSDILRLGERSIEYRFADQPAAVLEATRQFIAGA